GSRLQHARTSPARWQGLLLRTEYCLAVFFVVFPTIPCCACGIGAPTLDRATTPEGREGPSRSPVWAETPSSPARRALSRLISAGVLIAAGESFYRKDGSSCE